MNQLMGVILAGGKSLRMGKDKSMVRIDGQTMLAHMISILSQTLVSNVIVNSNALSHFEGQLDLKNHASQQCIKDIIPNKGPLSGIHSALVSFPNADLLIVPVDMPMIAAESLNRLISNARNQKSNSRFTTLNSKKRGDTAKSTTMPLYIHNNSETREKLEHTLLNSKTWSVYHFCSHFPILEVLLENELELTNINFPEQLSQITKD